MRERNHRICYLLAYHSLIALFFATIFATQKIQAQELKADFSGVSPELQVLLRLDRNGDQILEPLEVPKEVQDFVNATIRKYEKQGKGVVGLAPLQTGKGIDLKSLTQRDETHQQEPAELPTANGPGINPKIYKDYASVILASLDTDRDGILNQKEAESMADKGRRIDFDENGKITQSELEIQFRNGWDKGSSEKTNFVSASFSEMDRNQNGQLEMHEFATDWTDEIFQQFLKRDYNKNGIVSSQEWLRHEVDNLKKSENNQLETNDD